MAAVWQMFFVRREARRALKRMDTILNQQSTYPTFGTQTSNTRLGSVTLPFSPDALVTPWGELLDAIEGAAHLAHSNPTLGLRRSNRIAALTKQDSRGTLKKKTSHSTTSKKVDYTTVTTPSPLNSPKTDEEMAASILHHAWARAVERDSTFIVLHCGGYERIAFRHRSTQTLFVSDLINVNKCSDPGYGAIHLGLFISILSDALDRAAQRAENPTQTSKKRRRSVVASDEPRKRPRTRTTVASEATKKLVERQQLQVP
ncbi:hypothetical protein H0H93_015915 [Arthromyces matolae]|nr:hypothetical protein H0H93_015915 [Arthromyces matolae]